MAKDKKSYEEMTPEEKYAHDLRQYHKNSERHVWCPEAELTYHERIKCYSLAEKLRKMSNELTSVMNKNYEQLMRTKRYRKLKGLYGNGANELNKIEYELEKLNKTDNPDEAKVAELNAKIEALKSRLENLSDQMKEMRKQYNVTWDFCYKQMDYINKRYGAHAHFARSAAEDVWSGVEDCLFGDGEKLNFAKRGELPVIRARERAKGIVIKNVNGRLRFDIKGSSFGHKAKKVDGLKFNVKVDDKFDNDESEAILNYLLNATEIDDNAVKNYRNGVIVNDTYRPCYVSLVCETIRGKMRVFVHVTIEGKAKPKYKYNKETETYERRHQYGVGIVTNDIGTQSVAYTSDSDVGLYNLAERGESVKANERSEKILQRAMDRSQRAMNPENYNDDGTIKKGKKEWKVSNRQKKRKKQHKAKCRINAINRHLAIREDAHKLRALGDTMITEPKNAKQLQQRTEVVNENTGVVEHHKNHGKAIQNRCPGYYQAFIKQLFESTGGKYIEVPYDFRASQYDHTNGTYTKKDLSERVFTLSDGTVVQRDWYSSFLMYCADLSDPNHIKIDRNKCLREFPRMYAKYLAMVQYLKDNGIQIMNSGISIKCTSVGTIELGG